MKEKTKEIKDKMVKSVQKTKSKKSNKGGRLNE